MKLSIITICYNIKEDIVRTCESIVNQTWQDFEWIVIDGASTDGTLEVLEKYKDRINIFISEKDEGIYDAMNKGILKASGKYLNFMNGGDEFNNEEVLIKAFSSIKDSDVYYGYVNYINLKKNRNKILFFPEYLPTDFFLQEHLNQQSTFIKKELFEKYGLYNTVDPNFTEVEKFIFYKRNNVQFELLPLVIANFYIGGYNSENAENISKNICKHYTYEELLSIKPSEIMFSSTSYSLFEFIPLLKKVRSKNKIKYFLFSILPILTIRTRSS